MAALIAASGFFSASETALFYLSREEIRRMQSGHTAERVAAALMHQPDRLLTVVLFWNLMINLAYFSVNLVTAKRLVDAGQTGAAGLLSLGGLVGLILFGEVCPKSFAVLFRRRVAILASVPLSVAARILDPVLPMLAATTGALRRVLYPQLKLEPFLEVDDIERAVETSELGVELVQLEQQLLSRILEFSDMTVEEVMRPRGTYHVWQPPVDLEELKSRGTLTEILLIGGDDHDSVTGALALYDLNSIPKRHLENVAEKVIHVPWCSTVADTLTALRSKLVSVASVVNEYGETIGIITEDDILDTLLNPHSSRGRRLLEREPVVLRPDGSMVADGLTTLRYLASRLDHDYDPEEDAPVTLAALLHDELERFPVVGDECRWEGYLLRVVEAGEPGEAIQVEIQRPATPPPLVSPEEF